MPALFASISVDPGVAGVSWWAYANVLLLLCGILCLVYVLAQVVSRRLPLARRSAANVISVIDRFQLEPRRAVYVLRAGSQYMAVASSERGIDLITHLDAAAFHNTAPEPQRHTREAQ